MRTSPSHSAGFYMENLLLCEYRSTQQPLVLKRRTD